MNDEQFETTIAGLVIDWKENGISAEACMVYVELAVRAYSEDDSKAFAALQAEGLVD